MDNLKAKESDAWRLKEATSRTPVYFLNTHLDFTEWHKVFRKMVVSYNMVEALMYTIPAGQEESMKSRMAKVKGSGIIKKEGEYEPFVVDPESKKMALPSVVDLTAEAPLKSTPKSEEDLVYMKSMGITKSLDAYFSSTTSFINVRTGTPDTDREAYFRQEIWLWMDKSLSKGNYDWLPGHVGTMFDIHELHRLIMESCSKITWISFAIEYKKIFMIKPKAGGDIFRYHSEMQEQIRLVKSQAEALDINPYISPLIENFLLLIAAWENPRYRRMALEFTMDDKSISAGLLIKELQKQQLLTAHLNKNQSESDGRPGSRRHQRDEYSDVRVHAAIAPPKKPPTGVCFAWQKGACTRGSECRFAHEESKPKDERKPTQPPKTPIKPQVRLSRDSVPRRSTIKNRAPSSSRSPSRKPSRSPGRFGSKSPSGRRSSTPKPQSNKCRNCGGDHRANDCKFDGECDYCNLIGHKASMCYKKKFAEKNSSARVAFVDPEEKVVVRLLCVSQYEHLQPMVEDVDEEVVVVGCGYTSQVSNLVYGGGEEGVVCVGGVPSSSGPPDTHLSSQISMQMGGESTSSQSIPILIVPTLNRLA